MYLAIHNEPFHKHLTRISPSFVGKSSHPTMDGKPADSPSVRPGTGKGNTSIHIPFGTARQEGVFARPAAAWAAQRKQSIHRKRLFVFSVGAASSADVTSLRNTDIKFLSGGKHPAWSQRNCAHTTQREGRAEWLYRTVHVPLVKRGEAADFWSLLCCGSHSSARRPAGCLSRGRG